MVGPGDDGIRCGTQADRPSRPRIICLQVYEGLGGPILGIKEPSFGPGRPGPAGTVTASRPTPSHSARAASGPRAAGRPRLRLPVLWSRSPMAGPRSESARAGPSLSQAGAPCNWHGHPTMSRTRTRRISAESPSVDTDPSRWYTLKFCPQQSAKKFARAPTGCEATDRRCSRQLFVLEITGPRTAEPVATSS